MSTYQLPTWPPNLSPNQLDQLQQTARIYALANSLIFRLPSPNGVHSVHVPFTLLPTPFPRDQFEKAIRIQTAYNQLYSNIASSPDLIREVIGKSISKVDPFVGRLYELWEMLEKEESEDGVDEHFSLGIFRNDFLLHQSEPSQPLVIKQVEFNTVSVSFGSLASKVSGLHRYILGQLSSPLNRLELPESANQALQSISKALKMAHQHYLAVESPHQPPIILMIVKSKENNLFDQSLIEFELDSGVDRVRTIRLNCDEVLKLTRVDGVSKKMFYEDDLMGKWLEVSVVYYRSMYGPEDFVSEDDWKARYELERSRAINCPSLSIQLSGCKKFQQILTDSDFLDRHSSSLRENILDWEWEEIRSTWMTIYSLDDPEGLRIVQDLDRVVNFVLKPQREGGGNNLYGGEIVKFVDGLKECERSSWVLMRLIESPKGLSNYLVRSKSVEEALTGKEEIISELGIYGCCLLSRRRVLNDEKRLLFNFQDGYLLRTKHFNSGEGGVAIGISCLDSPILIK